MLAFLIHLTNDIGNKTVNAFNLMKWHFPKYLGNVIYKNPHKQFQKKKEINLDYYCNLQRIFSLFTELFSGLSMCCLTDCYSSNSWTSLCYYDIQINEFSILKEYVIQSRLRTIYFIKCIFSFIKSNK